MKTTIDNIEDLLLEQFKTNTGTHFLDSGGESGRRWQQNATKTFADFMSQPAVTVEGLEDLKPGATTEDIWLSVDTFQYMLDTLELDSLCREFNSRPVSDWDSEAAYGLSSDGEQFLTDQGLEIQKPWNSYNYDSNLDYTLQGAGLIFEGQSNFEHPEYVLLQIHLGADVRGGYTDAKLYKLQDGKFLDANPRVYGTIDGVDVDTGYNGVDLTNEDGKPVKITKNSKFSLSVSEQ